VHEAIVHVMAQVGYVQKQDASGLPYSFASETAFIKAVRPSMVSVGLFVYQSNAREMTIETFRTSKDKVAHKRVFKFEYTFVHAPSQTDIIVSAVGEGDDFGDKGSNKAMTVALKYALRQTLLIETGDDPDETSSDVFDQTEAIGGKAWSEDHIKAMLTANPDADDVQCLAALRVFSQVTGWTEKTDAQQYSDLAVFYRKQKAIAEQDGDSAGFKMLVTRAYSELQAETDEVKL